MRSSSKHSCGPSSLRLRYHIICKTHVAVATLGQPTGWALSCSQEPHSWRCTGTHTSPPYFPRSKSASSCLMRMGEDSLVMGQKYRMTCTRACTSFVVSIGCQEDASTCKTASQKASQLGSISMCPQTIIPLNLAHLQGIDLHHTGQPFLPLRNFRC